MPIKLSKVARELNVGIQTLVNALAKKGKSVAANPNTSISDEQHQILLNEFKSAKAQRDKSNKFLDERKQEKAKAIASEATVTAKEEPKKAVESKPATTASPAPPKPAVKVEATPAAEPPKPATPEPAATPETPAAASEAAAAPATVTPEPEEKPASAPAQEKPAEAATKPSQTPQAESKPEPAATPQAPAAAPQVVAAPATETPEGKKDDVFTIGVPISKTPKVIGTIDLSAINQQTRPKKKTKEERRRERADKDKTHQTENADGTQSTTTGDTTATGDRKKRRRIGKEKIDIEKSASQIQQQPTRGGSASSGDSRKARTKNRRPLKPELSEEEVQKQVKETLSRLTSKTSKKSAKWRKEKREDLREREREAAEQQMAESKILKLTEFVTANDLAIMMNQPINKVIGTCMSLGVMVSINQRLDAETINIVAEEFGFQTEFVSHEVVEAINAEADAEEDLLPRPPVVTVMGHVDHGKTSLLDYIRKANVIAGEAGGITQHIGAYSVDLNNGQHITFLDTPGHEAFTAMRARGAKVTDIAIIIIAADDNIMPQTIEAINHASAAGVPMVFAINKIDKPGADPEKIKEGLANMNYLVEDWGGKYQSQDISAKKGIGVTDLLDKVLLEAEMLELKANPNRRATGSIIESSLDKGRGYVATVLVQNGTLHVGDIVLAGTHYGRVKAMFNERNQRIKEAGPAFPAQILGLNGAPTAGDTFNVMGTEQEAREIASKREQLQRELGLRTQKRVTLEDIGRRKALGSFNELNIIVKGDVDGSIEALSDSLIKLSTPEVQVNVLHKAVGAVSESDVVLASASDAYIIGFQVRPSQAARKLAEKEGVDIRIYSVIYQAIDEVKSAMEGLLSPEIKEEILGTAEVLETFHISKVGTIAGAMVREGKIKRSCKVRVIRDGIVRYTGDLGSLKRFKDDAKEVVAGFDCGLSIVSYNDILVGDIIESFEEVAVKKSLS